MGEVSLAVRILMVVTGLILTVPLFAEPMTTVVGLGLIAGAFGMSNIVPAISGGDGGGGGSS